MAAMRDRHQRNQTRTVQQLEAVTAAVAAYHSSVRRACTVAAS
jgi:hypothetical protein